VHSATMRLLPTPVVPTIRRAEVPRHVRYSSSNAAAAAAAALQSPRWLSDCKTRIGKCIMFGISPEQTAEAGSILQEMSSEWRELVAGSEGFLTGEEYRGLYRHEVVWGEMVRTRKLDG
jgi:hypothetical protein